MKDALAWVGLFLAAIVLILMGFEGSAGKVFAVVFAPAMLESET